jgi:hypothetical protein
MVRIVAPENLTRLLKHFFLSRSLVYHGRNPHPVCVNTRRQISPKF